MNTKILGHRGASFYAPENTMPAVEMALEQGADGVELDVHLSKDGELVVIHDEKLDRTTNAKGFVGGYTLEELKSFDASCGREGFAGVKIPTLREVYSLFQGTGKMINVEVKTDIMDYPGIVDKLLALEDEMAMQGSILYSSFNHYSVYELLTKRPTAKIGLLYMSIFAAPWSYAASLGAAALHPHFITISKTPLMAEECAKRGIETNIWTVDDPAWMEKLAAMGVTSLITDRPDLAKTVVYGH